MIVNYSIYFYKSRSGNEVVIDFIDSLDEKTQVRVRNAIRFLKENGLGLLGSSWIKKMRTNPDIFELRITGETQVRFLFCKYDSKTFLVLSAFVKKTQKTPLNEIKLAAKRAKEFI